MDGEELRLLLCRLEPGMAITVPDKWFDKTFPGSRVERAKLVSHIARQFGCSCEPGIDFQRFEKLDFPRTG